MKLNLTGLTVTGYHGVLAFERENGQPFTVDIELSQPVPEGDQLGQTTDYGALADQVAAIIAGPPVNLIETLATRIAKDCLKDWPLVDAITVSVHKPNAPIAHQFNDVCATVHAARFTASLGANLGDTMATLKGAIDMLAATPEVAVEAISDVYATPAIIEQPRVEPAQPNYHNLVVVGSTTLEPAQLLARTAAIELAFGRRRPYPKAPRTLDIDLVTVGDASLATPTLTLPHPRAAQRGFVLVPWAQISPLARLPEGPIGQLIDLVDCTGIERLGPLPQTN